MCRYTPNFTERFDCSQRPVEIRQNARYAAGTSKLNFGGASCGAPCESDHIIVGNREAAAGVGAVEAAAGKTIDYIAHRTIQGDASYPRLTGNIVLRIDPASIGIPDDTRRAEIPIGCEVADIRSVAVHDIEVVVLVGSQCIIESEIGNQLPVRRYDRIAVRTIAIGQLANSAGRHIERIDLTFD